MNALLAARERRCPARFPVWHLAYPSMTRTSAGFTEIAIFVAHGQFVSFSPFDVGPDDGNSDPAGSNQLRFFGIS
jgi:hypothetical protein